MVIFDSDNDQIHKLLQKIAETSSFQFVLVVALCQGKQYHLDPSLQQHLLQNSETMN